MIPKDAGSLIECFKFWLPLAPGVIDVAVRDKSGIYIIKKDNEFVYVGRSVASLRRRLLQHCRRFPGHVFGVLYVDSTFLCMRYEYRIIERLRRSSRLKNSISASVSLL